MWVGLRVVAESPFQAFLSPTYVQRFDELRALNYDVCINTAILDTDFDYRINELSI